MKDTKTHFNIIWNEDEARGYGKGWYVFFEGALNKEIIFEKYFPTIKHPKAEQEEFVHESVILLIKDHITRGLVLDTSLNKERTFDEVFN